MTKNIKRMIMKTIHTLIIRRTKHNFITEKPFQILKDYKLDLKSIQLICLQKCQNVRQNTIGYADLLNPSTGPFTWTRPTLPGDCPPAISRLRAHHYCVVKIQYKSILPMQVNNVCTYEFSSFYSLKQTNNQLRRIDNS